MSAVLFFIAGIGVIAGALGVVLVRDPFYTVLSLVTHLIFLAVLFLLLRAEFVAAAQVIVYAGAVMVLYVFVVAYVGEQQPLGDRLHGGRPAGAGLRVGAVVFGTALLVELFIALLGTGLAGIDTKGSPYIPGFGQPRAIGNLLLTKFLLSFEVASYLLLIAAVGAVVLARRRGGLPGGEGFIERPALPRPRGTGTMAEGVDSLAFAAAHADQEDEELPVGIRGAAGPAGPDESSDDGEGGW